MPLNEIIIEFVTVRQNSHSKIGEIFGINPKWKKSKTELIPAINVKRKCRN